MQRHHNNMIPSLLTVLLLAGVSLCVPVFTGALSKICYTDVGGMCIVSRAATLDSIAYVYLDTIPEVVQRLRTRFGSKALAANLEIDLWTTALDVELTNRGVEPEMRSYDEDLAEAEAREELGGEELFAAGRECVGSAAQCFLSYAAMAKIPLLALSSSALFCNALTSLNCTKAFERFDVWLDKRREFKELLEKSEKEEKSNIPAGS